ncbi:MAG TPA: dienelactone hydrolase family protein [Actinomycetota bacterium]|jgi:pimeloyl-ACP methyl ester carboxylesterase|nr:dienelactone hydrolase family protein [Actinomycetota bacterium]
MTPIPGAGEIEGDLWLPGDAAGLVVFAHGSGSSRHSPRNRMVATRLNEAGFGTLLVDLLTSEEEAVDIRTAHLRFDVGLLADRLLAAGDAVSAEARARDLPLGYFGASTGAAAALIAAAERPEPVRAIVSRGGRPDLAPDALPRVLAPTLLIAGSLDEAVIDMNRRAAGLMRCEVELSIVPGATHLFEEPGALEEVARRAIDWFTRHLRARDRHAWSSGC